MKKLTRQISWIFWWKWSFQSDLRFFIKYQLDGCETILKLSAEEKLLSIHRRNELVKLLENTYNYTCLCSFLVREKLPTTRLFTITCTCIKYSLFFFCYIHFVFCRQHKHLWLYYLYNNLHYHSIKTMSNTLYKVNKCTHKHLILHLQLISVIYIYV